MKEIASHFAAPPNEAMVLPEQDEAVPLTVLGASREMRVAVSDLERLATEYLLDCEYRGHQPHTVANNRTFLANFCWFLRQKCRGICGRQEIKQFLHYLQQEPGEGGRWGIPRLNKPLRPITARTYHRCLMTYFRWLVEEEVLRASPMEKIKAPTVRNTLKEPLNDEQVKAMLEAARTSTNRHRDTALLMFLLDSGCRAAEVCNLRMRDVDLKNRSARVIGKGNKIRAVYWGVGTSKALLRYLRGQERLPDATLFIGLRGTQAGEPLSPSGLLQLMQRLGDKAGVKCSCHDWRRTFAVRTLNAGANLIAVSRIWDTRPWKSPKRILLWLRQTSSASTASSVLVIG